jgi:hypothetical protein
MASGVNDASSRCRLGAGMTLVGITAGTISVEAQTGLHGHGTGLTSACTQVSPRRPAVGNAQLAVARARVPHVRARGLGSRLARPGARGEERKGQHQFSILLLYSHILLHLHISTTYNCLRIAFFGKSVRRTTTKRESSVWHWYDCLSKKNAYVVYVSRRKYKYVSRAFRKEQKEKTR